MWHKDGVLSKGVTSVIYKEIYHSTGPNRVYFRLRSTTQPEVAAGFRPYRRHNDDEDGEWDA